ncbi:hypothetical protein PQX77_005428 [Marasmius sp. AFHP31]|nr:hypothetical protein PQX77_005428 [Marasmius sp. AFHP31]
MGLVLVSACLLGLGVLWLASATRKSRSRSLPPGPPADPIIGHLRVIPTRNTPDTFHEWRKTYGAVSYILLGKWTEGRLQGDVMYLDVLGRKTVVLGSAKAAQALLDNRSANYSCRPKLPIFELIGFGNVALGFMQYGKQMLKHRKMFQQYLGVKESQAFSHTIAEEARHLVKNLNGAAPETHRHFIHRYAVSNIMRVAFGHQIKSDDDTFLKIGNAVSDVFQKLGPTGGTPVDFFPWLRHMPSWFPGTHYATVARSLYPTVRRLYDVPLEMVREKMKTQNYERCFASEKLQELDDSQIAEELELEDIKGAGVTIFTAGADTTYATLLCFYLAIVFHPECQRRAYEEIVSVVGDSALPDFNDRESLPYVECILQEVLRGMSIDEDVYSDPKKFNPARFLPKPEGKGEPPFTVGWGFGRRVCPGRHFASLALWHAIACTLATLEIVPKKDEAGNPKLPEVAFSEGFVCEPLPFEFEVHPRSEAAKRLIQTEYVQ